MSDAEDYAQRLTVTDPLREPIIARAIQTLRIPLGSQGLDAGCGIGSQALLLARAVGPAGHVTGMDISSTFLSQADAGAKRAGLADRLSFGQGDLNDLPFCDNAFDWLWSADCAGYPTRNPTPLLSELCRVTRPGGTVSILVWSCQMLLPGYPGLEARLNATTAGIAPFARAMKAEHHHLCALGWFRDAGLLGCTAHTLVSSLHAPLSDEGRDALIALFEMRWPGAASEVSKKDWEQLRRLCRAESKDCILDRPDYYAFVAESLFSGKVARY